MVALVLAMIFTHGFLASLEAQDKEAEGSIPQTVNFPTEDGFSIVGIYYPPNRPAAPALILLHMLDRNRDDWNELAKRLYDEGYAVLSIDLRGHGESIRHGEEIVTWQGFESKDYRAMAADVRAAMDFLKGQEDIDLRRIGIIGASIGCNVGLNYAVSDENVRTLVMLSPGLNYKGIKTEYAIRAYGQRPVFIAVSIKDTYSDKSSRKLYDRTEGKKKLQRFIDAGHGTDMLAERPKLTTAIVDWLKETLQSE